MRRWQLAGVSVVLFAALVAMRVRYLSQEPVGEESFFSQLALWGHRGVAYVGQLPSAFVDGAPFAQDAEHPSAPYWWFYALGSLLRAAPSLSTAGVIEALRAITAIVFAGAIALGFHLCAPARSLRVRAALAVACFVLLSTPFWVGCSVQLQQDGVLGTIPYVLVFAAAHARARSPSRGLAALAGLGGFLVAFDKPERVLLFVGAAVASWAVLRIRGRRVARAAFAPEAIGLAIGLALVMVVDRAHWLQSFDVAHRIAAADAQATPSAYLAFVGRFLPLSFVALALATAAIARPPAEIGDPDGFRSLQLAIFVALTLASALRLRWLGDSFPRYFAPAAALMTLWLIMQAGALWSEPAIGWRRIGRALLAPLAGLVMWQTWMHFPAPGRRSITSTQGSLLAPLPPDLARTDCIPLVGLDSMNVQSGSWAIGSMYTGVHGLGGRPFCP
jgi:hypothetical protein